MKQLGFSLIEILIVITIIGILFSLSIPAYQNYIHEQSVIQTLNGIKTEMQTAMNKSSSGTNAHWYGLTFESATAVYANNNTAYNTFEILNTEECPISISNINTPPCSNSSHKTIETKTFLTGVYLDHIWLYNNNGNHIDTVGSLDIRFNQSPNTNYIAFSSSTATPGFKADVVRSELVFKFNNANNNHEKALVIDGGNICDQGTIIEPTKCSGDFSGGPKPGRFFIVNIN
jgi:prepilin-type N-terminal cleavage/methylation domain-containing protein